VILRKPLNAMQPRTVREASRDPFDWWEAYPRRSFLAWLRAAFENVTQMRRK
jgi:hypothetical protein